MSESVDSINPNVNVTSNLNKSGAIEADATGGPLSFDELEEITMNSKRAKTDKKPEKEADGKKDKSIDLTSDTDKGKAKEAKPKAEKEPVKEAKEAKESEESEAPKPPRKTIKAKYADAELDLDEEAVVPVKINGKEELVPIKDLLGNYSGKVAWDKKFSEIDMTRKQVSARELKINQMAEMVKSAFEEADPQLKMYKLAQLSGVDPVEFRQKFYNEQISLLEKYYSMSEDERKADALAYEASIHKHRADTLEKTIKEEQDYKSLQSKVNQLRERHQVSDREFFEMFDHLEKQAQSGQLDPKALTPETVIEKVQESRLFNSAWKALEGLDLGWDQKTQVEKIFKLTQNAKQIGLKPEDMAEMVDELWGVKRARNKIEDKKKQNQEFLTGKKDVAQAKPASSEVWSFDQI